MADDMGYGDVGCYNPDSKIPTPNMDALAAEGICFTDAHSPSAVCTPSRYGVITGRYCWRSNLKRSVLFGYEPPLIETDRLTVGKLLQGEGYHTACIGKWHIGLEYATKPGKSLDFDAPLPWRDPTREDEESIDFTGPVTGGPTELGFDYFFGTAGCATSNPPYGFIENDRFVSPPSVYRAKNWFTARPGMTSKDWDDADVDPAFTRKAVQYIEERSASDEPFFLYLTPTSPHEPCLTEVTPEFARGKSAAGPRGDLVWLVDWMVGEVMDALERMGQAENTLIMVTSDNGAMPGDARLDQQHDGHWHAKKLIFNTYDHKSNGDWRGYKGNLWEGGHREPLIARWPDRIEPGTQSDQLTCLTDFLATCAAINGVDLAKAVPEDSVNMLPVLLGEQSDEPIRDSLVHHSAVGTFSIRLGQWKCIFDDSGLGGFPARHILDIGADEFPIRKTDPSPGELYNLAEDPAEEVNLWHARQDIVAQCTELLAQRQTGVVTLTRTMQ